MGRRFLMAVVVSAMALIAASAAFAAVTVPKKTLRISHAFSRVHRAVRPKALAGLSTASPSSFDTVLYDGYRAQCTAPNQQTNPTPENFLSSETMEYLTPDGQIVESCSADLRRTKTVDAQRIVWNHTAVVYATLDCTAFSPPSDTTTSQASDTTTSPASNTPTVLGTGISVTYPNGLFIETCTATP